MKKLPGLVRALCAVLALAALALLAVIWSGSGPFATNAGAVPLSLLAVALAVLFGYVAVTGHSPFGGEGR
jgi:fatty acid desaturase